MSLTTSSCDYMVGLLVVFALSDIEEEAPQGPTGILVEVFVQPLYFCR